MKTKKAAKPGGNKSGAMDKAEETRKTMQGAMEGKPSSSGGKEPMTKVCMEYIRESDGVGTMPSTGDMMEAMMNTVSQKPGKLFSASARMPAALGQRDMVLTFLDKLGERLAFERSGVRLYEGLSAKVQALRPETLTVEDVKHIRDEELEHFHMLTEVMSNFGADPTCETPCANVSGVAGMGLFQVVGDPRTNIAQTLQAILIAELADNDGWQMLIQLAEGIGFNKEADRFREALREEDEHVMKVRAWLSECLTGVPAHSHAA